MKPVSVKICSSQLTTCGVLEDGETVRLDLVDRLGNSVSVQLPFDQAEAVAMTLPQLLTAAVRTRTRDDAARYVFGLGGWSIESVEDRECLIVTLTTSDGFQVSFSAPSDTFRVLGSALKQERRAARDVN